jgi:hypothetical protein
VIGAVIVLAVAIVVLGLVIGAMMRGFRIEREAWATERRALIDRAIARHTGEVIAMDRNDRKPHPPEQRETRLVEGLS